MSTYKIVGLNNDNITLYYDGGKLATFVIPVTNGYLPVGEELTKLLDIFLDNYIKSLSPLPIKNLDAVQKLVVDLPKPMVTEDKARKHRDWLLFCTDWTQMPDSLSVGTRFTWACYRQELRDLPNNRMWPDMDWPIPPTPVYGPMGVLLTNVDGSPTLLD